MLRQKNRGIVCARDELHIRACLADTRLKGPRQSRKSTCKLLRRRSGEDGSRGEPSNNCGVARVSGQNANSQNGQSGYAQSAAKPRDSPQAFAGRRNTSQPEKPRSFHCRRMIVVEAPLRREVRAHYGAESVCMSTPYLLSTILYTQGERAIGEATRRNPSPAKLR